MVKAKTTFFIFSFFIASIPTVVSQTITLPNYALKSHPTLEIKKIETTSSSTTFYLSIENQIEGGSFCADKNIYIIFPDGTRSKMIYSNSIPVCPDTYKFKTIGEKLDFTLSFPAVAAGIQWVDLREDCTDNCFSFYGVTLDNDLNKKIDEAYSMAEKGELSKAVTLYIGILENIDALNYGVEGALYTDLISLAKDSGDDTTASVWYKKLLLSNAPRLEVYIKNLNSRGIKY